jgi:hypothetical protein
VKSDERLVDLIERLKTRNDGGLAAWEPRLRGPLKADKDSRGRDLRHTQHEFADRPPGFDLGVGLAQGLRAQRATEQVPET